MQDNQFTMRVNKRGAVIKSNGETEHFDRKDLRKKLEGKVITSFHYKQTDGKETTLLSDLLNRFRVNQENQFSPHGERVLVTLLPDSHFRKRWFRHGCHLRVHFTARTMSGKSVFDNGLIQMVLENANGNTNWIEVVRCLLQCSESGYSATVQDEDDLHFAFMGTHLENKSNTEGGDAL